MIRIENEIEIKKADHGWSVFLHLLFSLSAWLIQSTSTFSIVAKGILPTPFVRE